MRVEDFDFELPASAIALRPAHPRDSARMLVVRANGALEHRHVRDLPEYLFADDVVVANNTRVIAARMSGRRLRGAGPKIEVTLHKRVAPDRFRAFAKPARKLEAGDRLELNGLKAVVIARGIAGEIELGFDVSGQALDRAIAAAGDMPLPPYIAGKRKPDARDRDDYQTVFASAEGSVAAPTAGLHFTPQLRARLQAGGVAEEQLTLHVGAGTFLPVNVDDTADHRMHAEFGELAGAAADRINAARMRGGRILAVGTTSLRTLESAVGEDSRLREFAGDITLFITPGYRFRAVDMLLTNFHLPRSTLFMLVSAFCGLERMKQVYSEALARDYRFYSYGDACLLFRKS
jgi:S-adenosylmethionine:tRNA ribosyltransferase-isomerase